MPKRAGFWQYIKRAFLQHWNLLAFGAGVAAGVISGHADVVVPLVVAGELAYLTGLTVHPKFQAHVDAQLHKEGKAQAADGPITPAVQRIFATLDKGSRQRFEQLTQRCQQLRRLSRGIAHRGGGSLDEMQVDGVNKLLWVFLKLLYSRHVLRQFIDSTDEAAMHASLKKVEASLEALGSEQEDTPHGARRRRTLTDTAASVRVRLENLRQARKNHEYIELELDRIESKTTSIAEMAVNRQDPDFVSSEVDGVAATMAQTEATMSELHLLTDLETANAPPPAFLQEEVEVQ